MTRRSTGLDYSSPAPARPAAAATLPSGFGTLTVLGGLSRPTAVAFAEDGKVFVAEKSGLIKVFGSLDDSTPTVFADLRDKVHNFWDRGLLGLALDPRFSTDRPYVYALYTYDAPIGGTPPTWGDGCPTPPGPTTDGCVVSGRLVKMTASGSTMSGTPKVLIEDWCQQYPSHSIGSLLFGNDGALYVSGGDGASFTTVDYGQFAGNPCNDPPGGSALAPPSAEGGALRSQSVRRADGPTTLDGTILRIDPDTGEGLAGNPFAGSADRNKRRVIAYGLRNPFRFTSRPGTNQLWAGDVGAGTWEEINRVAATGDGVAENFG